MHFTLYNYGYPIPRHKLSTIGEPYVGKVYVDYRIKRHTPLPVLYISPPPTLLNFLYFDLDGALRFIQMNVDD